MGKFSLVVLVVSLVLVVAVGFQFLIVWGILASLKGLGMIAGYTTAKIWWGTLLLSIVCGIFSSFRGSRKD